MSHIACRSHEGINGQQVLSQQMGTWASESPGDGGQGIVLIIDSIVL